MCSITGYVMMYACTGTDLSETISYHSCAEPADISRAHFLIFQVRARTRKSAGHARQRHQPGPRALVGERQAACVFVLATSCVITLRRQRLHSEQQSDRLSARLASLWQRI